MSQRPLRLSGILLPEGSRRDLFVREGRITFEPVDGADTIVTDGYLLPGLVDAHAHLALASPAPDGASMADVVRASARAQLDRGVLAVREPGGPTRDSAAIGPAEGLPRVVTGGRFIAARGGYFRGLAREVDPGGLAEAAVDEHRASGHWAKVVGDFFDASGSIGPTFGLADVRAAADAVHAAGGRLAIHAMAAATIEMAIDAGVDSIEHATELAPEHLTGIAGAGITLVPTMLIREPIRDTVEGMGLSEHETQRWRDATDRQPEMVRRAAAAGIRILAGTDAGMVAHGLVLEEVARLRAAGLDGHVALGAASWDARAYLGWPGLEEGAPADIVVFDRDPRSGTGLERPVVRILDGRRVEG
jgi:imidazolonepropionase-like amidohydrolase